jgi:hypothetical protein
MQSIASLVMASKVPGVQRLASVLDAFSNPATIPLEDCNILGGHNAWARFFRSGELSLLNTKRLADFIGCQMGLLMPAPDDSAINYWDCPFHDYDEYPDDGGAFRSYGCTHPSGDGMCDLGNKWCGRKCHCPLLAAQPNAPDQRGA